MGKAAILILVCLLVSADLPGCSFQCVKEAYTSQIGVTERGGANAGPEVAEYLAVAGFDYPVPWCAAFIAWSFDQCGVEASKSAWSPAWFPSSRCIDPEETKPRSVDVFGIYFRNKGRIAHVGFVDDWPPGKYFITVEGNTNKAGSRDGDGVYRKRRLKKQAYKISRWL